MGCEKTLRRILWAAAAFNVVGAIAFGFPASFPGRLMSLPADAPALYRALTALFILLFGGAYAWTAHRRPLLRPFVVFGAAGKTGAFVAAVAVWLAGACPPGTVLVMSGDVLFAALFAWGLAGTSGTAAAEPLHAPQGQ